jgi:hypothetical protein
MGFGAGHAEFAMNRVLTALLAIAAAGGASSQPLSFIDDLYPALDKAGCKHCHNPDGVASGTRLHFPDEAASRERIAAFGESLMELVDRSAPAKSLLINKPTNRIKHSGGEKIQKGSPEETLLTRWIGYLATMPEARVRQALSYRRSEAGNYGRTSQAVLRRLTHQQYANTVRDLLKEASDITSRFPPEDFVDGFKNQYRSQSLSPILVEAYSAVAEKLAENVFRRGDSRKLIPCDYSTSNASKCRAEFIEKFGRRAFRRPLLAEETARYTAIFKAELDFMTGAKAVIEGMLQSPSFLFWMESTQRPEWKAYATASRLAYGLWNSAPDDKLLDNAAKGDLDSPEGIERTARQMLLDTRAKQGLDEFVSQWLRFDRALAAARERRTFPMFNRELVTSMVEEARRFVADLVWNDRNFMDVVRADYGFVNSELAAIYNVPAPPRDFERVQFPPEQGRAGVLGQALFLTLTSKPEETAPTSRGLFIREQFLCQQVPPPPPGVDTNLPPVEESLPRNNRERLASHTSNKACASCHALIDPIGFAFEKFDAVGMYHAKPKLLFYPDEHEAKKPQKEVLLDVDTSGQIAGVPNSDFDGPRQLGERLAEAEQCQECIVKQIFRYLSGRRDTRGDAPLIRQTLNDFRRSGFRFKELLVSLLTSREAAGVAAPREETADGQRHYQTP